MTLKVFSLNPTKSLTETRRDMLSTVRYMVRGREMVNCSLSTRLHVYLTYNIAVYDRYCPRHVRSDCDQENQLAIRRM